MDVPFVIYADFECILKKVNETVSSKTVVVQKHLPYAYSYFIQCNYNDQLSKFKIYHGTDASSHFFKSLVEDVKDIYEEHLCRDKKVAMEQLTESQLAFHYNTLNCHICDNELLEDRVADHCHWTGKYRGPSHNKCNLEYQLPNFIPIFFHNLSHYDSHLFVKELSSIEGSIDVIPLNKEKYISFSKKIYFNRRELIELRFLDSFRFMPSSLDSLSKNLSDDDLKITKSFFTNKTDFDLMKRKGVFAYDYLDSEDRLNETELPPQSAFFNKLTNESCTDENYKHAQTVWNNFHCRNLLDYLLLYLKIDVLLLSDVFQSFRTLCKRVHQLDPCQYYTAPGLSWDAMLRTTKIQLELLTDESMYKFISNGIRGGIVQCSKHYSLANNKYLNDYNEKLSSNYLVYLDVNNLYGHAMSQNLPHSNFQWVEDCENFNVMDIVEDSSVGFILEVDLDYPSSIHDSHNDFPFCAENKKINGMKNTKLIVDLYNKRNYIIHYKNLQQCLAHGLVLKKIHRILQFNQSKWLKNYIEKNNHHRTLAKNKFEENFFKLLNNAVFGKTMENIDKRVNVHLVQSWENHSANNKGRKQLGARALIAKPNFHSIGVFSQNLIAIQMKRLSVWYDKPIYVGFSVLELSKTKMYEFHYHYMKVKYQDNITLNYMDTDSFIYDVKTDDFYKDIQADIPQHFDTSYHIRKTMFTIFRC